VLIFGLFQFLPNLSLQMLTLSGISGRLVLLLTMLLSICSLVLQSILMSVTYVSLRLEKEGVDIDTLVDVFR
ncbi:MAG: hypothetical protein AAGJ35_11070, partial [Myxococcota bacterium]